MVLRVLQYWQLCVLQYWPQHPPSPLPHARARARARALISPAHFASSFPWEMSWRGMPPFPAHSLNGYPCTRDCIIAEGTAPFSYSHETVQKITSASVVVLGCGGGAMGRVGGGQFTKLPLMFSIFAARDGQYLIIKARSVQYKWQARTSV